MSSDARAAWAAASASLVLHALLAAWLVWLAPSFRLADPAGYELELALAPATDTRAEPPGARRRGADRPLPGGPRSAQNVDAEDRGQGGDERGATETILLLPRADDVLLQDSPMNALYAAQTQRIRTSGERATRDSRRATPSPEDEPFLASGAGEHRERRPVAATDAREGARVAPVPTERGAARDAIEQPAGSAVATTESGTVAVRTGAETGTTTASTGANDSMARAGTAVPSPGQGILGGAGTRASEAARVAHARPPVNRGPAATNAESRDPRVRDDTDAELLAARMMQSLVESSQRSAREAGAGAGGTGGGGAPGSGGGAREGGRASPHGPGRGAYAALDTDDARYHRWYLDVMRRVRDRLEFPRARALAMDQGLSVVRFTVRRNGALVGPPSLVRSSGFDDFDRAAERAIEQAAPFPPLPPELTHGVESHAVRMTVEHSNPMIR